MLTPLIADCGAPSAPSTPAVVASAIAVCSLAANDLRSTLPKTTSSPML